MTIQSAAADLILSALLPSGDTTGVTDTTAIQAALDAAANGQPVMLAAGSYYTLNPIVIPPGAILLGSYADEVADGSQGQYGTVISPVPGFTQNGQAQNAVILLQGQAQGGYASRSQEQKVGRLMLDCRNAPAGVTGVCLYGNVTRSHFFNLLVSYATDTGIMCMPDDSGQRPGALRMERVNVRYSGSYGIYLNRISDATYYDCLVHHSQLDNWYINTGSNSKYVACRSEWSAGGNGFTYTCSNDSTGSGSTVFLGCSTDRNFAYGMKITSANGAGIPLTLSACVLRRDGRNGGSGGGSYAGLYVTSYPSIVMVSGCNVFPGVDDDGTQAISPQYGLVLASNSTTETAVLVDCSYIQGASTAIVDDGTSSALFGPTVVTGTGTTFSPVVKVPPYLATEYLAGLRLSGSASSSPILSVTSTAPGAPNPAVRLVAAGGADAMVSTVVTGDTQSRWQIDSSGKQYWGAGRSAAADTFLTRVAPNVLGTVSTDFAVDTAGRGLQVREGPNAKQGTATLRNGTAAISNTSVTAGSRIFLTVQSPGGDVGTLYVSSRQPGVSFQVRSTSASDRSTFAYEIFEPAP